MRTGDAEKTRIKKSIVSEITGTIASMHLSKQEFAEETGIAYKSLYNKLKNPDTFRLDELLVISNVLNISIYKLLGVKDYTIKNAERVTSWTQLSN